MAKGKRPPKELIDSIEQNLLFSQITVENKLNSISRQIQSSIGTGQKRFSLLLTAIEKEFSANQYLKGGADGLTFFLFDSVFELYFIGNVPAVIVELHGLLERYCVDKLIQLVASSDESEEVLVDAFSKKTLSEVAILFNKLSLLSKDDVTFVNDLTRIRNGVVHKNSKAISNALVSGKSITVSAINEVVKNVDAIPYIVETLRILVNITKVSTPSFFQNPRFIARLNAYNGILPNIFNLFTEKGFIVFPDSIKDVMIRRHFSKTILLSTKEMDTYLSEFGTKVIAFHNALGVDENLTDVLYSELTLLGDKIFNLMQSLLQIDGPTELFVQPPVPDFQFLKEQILKAKL